MATLRNVPPLVSLSLIRPSSMGYIAILDAKLVQSSEVQRPGYGGLSMSPSVIILSGFYSLMTPSALLVRTASRGWAGCLAESPY